MKKSSNRRVAILSFIRDRVSDGCPPTLAEIAEACGLASRGAAQKHVKALQESGQLEASVGKARGARPKSKPKVAGSLTTFFEVTPAHIAELTYTDLHELVARLCIARLVAKGYSPGFVTWGGDQRAPDGGIDVRIQMPTNIATTSGFPRASIGFQVKAEKVPESKIQNEMCPGGMLRPSIRDLIRVGGAYIIASSETTADKPLQARLSAMRNAACGEKGVSEAEFDFYDAQRLTDWTNQHPGLVAWVRSRLGKALQGWRPFGQWANTRGAKPHPFLEDDAPRLVDPSNPNCKHSLVDGLQHVRSLLRMGGTSVRIAGLSGVGKTRFAQALFEKVAQSELAPELAIYTDIADDPVPTPLALLEELLANRRRAVLIVDNCASQLHTQLTTRCKANDCVSLLTIEYDIREDIPDETKVFRLEPGSAELIGKVIGQQFPHISQVNVATLCRFADGNSRVAIALANTLANQDSLAGISDNALFERLFWQRRQVDLELRRAAQVCALVYSFNIEDDELSKLATIADMTPRALHRHVDELCKRGLAQKRGPWRAVLPHAIANTLASAALSAVPHADIVDSRGRMLQSFSRRLGYLHQSPDALKIVQGWFASGNLLSDLTELTDVLVRVLQNVAPVDPEAVLRAIDHGVKGPKSAKFISTDNPTRWQIVRLLRSIAWDPKYFEICLDAMVRFALAESEESSYNSTREVIASLFTIYLSGTHATLEQRLNWIKRVLRNENVLVQRIGVKCLANALESRDFTSLHGFEFGARPRDYGLAPRGDEVKEWFTTMIEFAASIAVESTNIGGQVRSVMADHFRSLWTFAAMPDALEKAAARLMATTGWEKGWLAVKNTIRFDVSRMSAGVLVRLEALESLLRPTTLIARTKAIVLNAFSNGLDITNSEEDGNSRYERANEVACELGKLVVCEPQTLKELLPQLLENRQGRQWQFGMGMASAVDDPIGMWRQLVEAFEATSAENRNIQILAGFLSGVAARDRSVFEKLMDSSMSKESLVIWVPVLQLSSRLDSSGCERLLKSMDDPTVPARMFQYLGYGRATEPLQDAELSRLLLRLSKKPNGLQVAIHILSMHVFQSPVSNQSELARLAWKFLNKLTLKGNCEPLDFALSQLIKRFLSGLEGETHARLFLRKINQGLDDYSLSPFDIRETVAALFKVQPMAALDELYGGKSDDEDALSFERFDDLSNNPLDDMSLSTLIEWCTAGNDRRWERVAANIQAFDKDENANGLCWSQAAIEFLQRAPNAIRVAGALLDRIEPKSWTGSRAEIISARMSLIDGLEDLLGSEAKAKIQDWRSHFQQLLDRARQSELEQQTTNFERFE